MKLKGLLTVLVAAALVLAVGMTSNSLDAVETDPSDEFDTSWIPTQDNNPQQKNSEGGGGSGSGSSSSSSDTKGGSESGKDLESGGDIDSTIEQVKGTAEDTMDLSSGDTESQTKSGGGGGGGEDSDQKTLPLWRQLLNLLLEYIWHILAVLAGIAALVGGYVVYKRRFAGDGTGNPRIVYDVDTSNDVYRSWWEMVEMIDAEEPATKTPQEFAEIAVDEGLEQEAVSEITSLFEEALYGGKEVTKDQERRAREAVERLKAKGREAV